MLRRAWIFIASIVSLSVSAQLAYGLNIKSDNYDIYIGDLNSDGYADYYFSGKPLFLILHGDIATPLSIFPGDFWAYSSSNGEYGVQSYKIQPAILTQYLNSGALKLGVANVDYFMWRNGSSEQTNILLRAVNADAKSIVLANFPGSLLPLLSQSIPPNPKANISDRDIPLTLKDVNGDGTLDFLVGAYAYRADASGIPSANPLIASQAAPVLMIFTYDTLSRLTFVTDPVNGNRDYDYDKAGNRMNVAVNVASDSASEPQVLAAPTGLYTTQINTCAWEARWNAVTGATSYVVTNNNGIETRVTGTSTPFSCQAGTSPKYIIACRTPSDCSFNKAYF